MRTAILAAAIVALLIAPATADINKTSPQLHATKNYTKIVRLCRTVCSRSTPNSGTQECNTFCY